MQRDARDFDARVRRARQAGELHLLDVSDQPAVDEYSGVYWNRHVLQLAPATQATYRIAWDDGHEPIYSPAAGALHAQRTSGATAS